MSVPPLLRFGSSFESYIGGEVIVHALAVIAPGVILDAAPNSKIIIGAGVCIGMGSVIQVDAGTLEIEAGVSIGAGFLMVGEGKIGANACIGAATTVFRCSVPAGQVVAPGSLLGDKGRSTTNIETEASSQPNVNQPSSSQASLNSNQSTQQELEDFWAPSNNSNNINSNNGYNSSSTIKQPANLLPQQPSSSSIQPQTNVEQNTFGTHISGKTNIQRLLVTLFPHRQALNKPSLDDDESE